MTKKRLFSLPDEMDAGLKKIHDDTGIPMARLVRDGIQMVLAKHGIAVDSNGVKHGDGGRFKAKAADAPAQPKVVLPMPAVVKVPRARPNGAHDEVHNETVREEA